MAKTRRQRRKAFEPQTYTPGFKMHRDARGNILLHSDPAKPELMGKPVVTMAKPIAQIIHFASHAARRRVAKAAGVDVNDEDAVFKAIPEHAKPADIKRVPVLRGFDCDFATEMRGRVRRQEREQKERSLMDMVRQVHANLTKDGQAEGTIA